MCYEQTRANGPILRGKQILASPNVKPSPEEIKVIAECSGAEFVENVTAIDKNVDRVIVVADIGDRDFITRVTKRSAKVLIINGEGFMKSILHAKLVTGREYRIV